MSFFSSKSSSKSSTQNTSYTSSLSLGDLASGNIQSTGAVTVNGLWGEDLAGFLDIVQDTVQQATQSNSKLAGQAIQSVASGYQSAYSETTGILQQLKPVLMVAAGVAAVVYLPKILKGV